MGDSNNDGTPDLVKPTVRAGWESFWEALEIPDAPPFQRQEMRRAFYAGAWVMFHTFMSIGEGDEATAHAIIASIESEMRDFLEHVERGNA